MSSQPPGQGGADGRDAVGGGHGPLAGFSVAVMVERAAYHAGQPVRFTVTTTHEGSRPLEQRYPGWRRFELTVRDEHHHPVAETEVEAAPDGGFADRWLPGQMMILPVYWSQNEGPVVPAWSRTPPGPRVAPGRYRARVTWLGRPPGSRTELPDVWTEWFTIV